MSKISDIVAEIALPIANEIGVDLWDVEYAKEGGEWYLRIIIDSADGISIDQCEQMSRAIDPVLDEREVIPGTYMLEVSSAGLERTLKKPEHFARFIGHTVEVRLFRGQDGSKRFEGTLQSYGDDGLELLCDGATVAFDKANVSKVRLVFDWGAE